MGQGEVIKFLEGCNKPLSRKQIAEAMNEDPIKISHIIRNLLRWGEIEFVEYTGEKVFRVAGYVTGRRTRFFFIGRKNKFNS